MQQGDDKGKQQEEQQKAVNAASKMKEKDANLKSYGSGNSNSSSWWIRLKRFVAAFFSFFVVFGAMAFVCLLYEHGRTGTTTTRRRRNHRRHRRQERRGGGSSSRYRQITRTQEPYYDDVDDDGDDEEEEEIGIIAEQEMTPTLRSSSRADGGLTSDEQDARSRSGTAAPVELT